jgi:hypothetical protein
LIQREKKFKNYAKTSDILIKYDENRLELLKSKTSAMGRELGYEEAKLEILDLKTELSPSVRSKQFIWPRARQSFGRYNR